MRWRLSLIEAATIQDGTKSVKLNDRAPTVDLRARKLINLTSIEEFSLDLGPGAAVKTTVAAQLSDLSPNRVKNRYLKLIPVALSSAKPKPFIETLPFESFSLAVFCAGPLLGDQRARIQDNLQWDNYWIPRSKRSTAHIHASALGLNCSNDGSMT